MYRRCLILFFCVAFSILASAQASGGQIRREASKSKTEIKKSAKPRNNSTQVGKDTNKSSTIEPVSMSSLAPYNVVVSSFGILSNAQGLCRHLREEGWDANIYMDPSNKYLVLIVGTDSESEARYNMNNARHTYPNAWILKVENNHAFKFE